MIQEFKDFINRGNVVDLAVAVVIGGAFALVVTSFTKDILMPLVAAVVGEPSFDELTLDVGDSTVFYGTFLTALVNFLIVAFAVFLVVKAINSMQNLRKKDEEEAAAEVTEVALLEEIRDLLRQQA